jgi:hypothetical protein
MTRIPARLCFVAVATSVVAALTIPPASAANDGFSTARAGTAGFHNIEKATAAGFGELRDKNGIACIDNPGVGGMGIHYVNGARVGDATETAGAPEILVYEPERNGQLRLVAVEYVVLQSTWQEAGNTTPPSLFGKPFELVPDGNRYGLPPFYELHAWIWKNNPRGINDDWNPTVSCGA